MENIFAVEGFDSEEELYEPKGDDSLIEMLVILLHVLDVG